MTTEEKYDIARLYQDEEEVFTCNYCQQVVNPRDCKGCPIYCQSFNDD